MNNDNNDIRWLSAYGNQKRDLQGSHEIQTLAKLPPVPPKNHYQGYGLLDFIQKQGYSFAQGCIIKYVDRFAKKDGKKDLLKAKDYIDQLIAFHYPEAKCEQQTTITSTDLR